MQIGRKVGESQPDKHILLEKLNENICSELVDYTRSYLQTDKFGLHFGLDCGLWELGYHK